MHKTAIVIDLDETVIKSYNISKQDEIVEHIENSEYNYRIIEVLDIKSKSLSYETFITVQRPNLREFLLFCRKTFDYVCVWTAGTKNYANEIVNNFFIYNPDLVWNRSKVDKDVNGSRYKDINKIKLELERINNCRIKILMIDDIKVNCTNSDECYVIDKFNPFDTDYDNKLQTLMNIIDSNGNLIR